MHPGPPPEPVNGTSSKTTGARSGTGAGKLEYLLFEDLMRPTFRKMRAIAQHESVENCWSVSGHLRYRYKLKNDQNFYKVKSIFATVEQILDQQK
jgi:hypothetical protein